MRAIKSQLLVISICITLVFASLPLMVGCAAPAPTPAPVPTPVPAPAPTPAPTPPATPKVIELKFADMFPPEMDSAKCDDQFAKRITEGTGGRVKVTVYHAETLGKVSDHLDMIAGGICDIANVTPPFHPTTFTMATGYELPLLGIFSRAVDMDVVWELYYKGYLKGTDDYKLLALFSTPPMQFYFRNKITKLEDWKGLKIRTPSPNINKLVEAAGAIPVTMPTPETYMALERGMIDCNTTAWEVYIGFKLYEVAKYVPWNPVYVGCNMALMNKDKWNGLDTDIKSSIERVIDEYRYEYLRYYQDNDRAAPELLREKGAEIYEISASEWARLEQLAVPIQDEWIAEREAKGLPAQEMIDLIKKIVARYK